MKLIEFSSIGVHSIRLPPTVLNSLENISVSNDHVQQKTMVLKLQIEDYTMHFIPALNLLFQHPVVLF